MAKNKKQSVKVDEGIYLLDKTKQEKIINKNTIYTIFGQHQALDNGYPILSSVDENSDLVYAKKQIVGSKTNYFIKTDDNGLLYNPISASPNLRDHKFKLLKQNPDRSWQFTKANEVCFTQYIEFLRTRNTLYLKYSERAR